MKNLSIFILALLFTVQLSAQEKFLVGGSGTGKIAIINRESGEVEWSRDNPEKSECNSVVYTSKGNIALSYKRGAMCISPEGEVIFDFQQKVGKEEIQSMCEIKGGFLLGICGNPMRIIELDKKGEIKHEVSYDTGIENPHAQFRQIRKSKKGTYLVPLLATSKILEIDKNGELLREITLEQGPFSVAQNKKGDLFAACGHSGYIYKVDGKSGEVTAISSEKALSDSVNIEFGAEIAVLKNGNLLMANWLGHKGDLNQPILIELTTEGEVVWTMNRPGDIKFVSAVCPIY